MTRRRRHHVRRAFTLVESLVSIIIVGVMFTAALSVVSTSRAMQRRASSESLGHLLAEQLMSEILEQAYEEPKDLILFGLELNELGGTRANFDDVDDYHNWTASPPEDKQGNDLAGLAGWERSVTVAYANPNNLQANMMTDSGVKRIVVTVKHQGRVAAKLTAVRTGAGADALEVLETLLPPITQ